MIIVLTFHVIIALLSMGYITYVCFAPSDKRIQASYALVALTLVSGTYLVYASHAALLAACTSGLLYISAAAIGIIVARNRLARETVPIRQDRDINHSHKD